MTDTKRRNALVDLIVGKKVLADVEGMSAKARDTVVASVAKIEDLLKERQQIRERLRMIGEELIKCQSSIVSLNDLLFDAHAHEKDIKAAIDAHLTPAEKPAVPAEPAAPPMPASARSRRR